MTKAELVELLSGGHREHAAKLRTFRKGDLERFLEAQSDPANHEVFPVGSFVYCGWVGSKGIVLHTEEVPGSKADRFTLTIKTGPSGRIQAESNDVIRVA